VVGIPPHDELETLAEVGGIEGGTWLYRCHQCGNCWELTAWTYFPEASELRRVLPVASLEKWTGKHRRAMKPHSLPVAGAFLFGTGVLCLGALAGTWWLVEMLSSREAAEWTVFLVVMACLLFLCRLAQRQEALRLPHRAEQEVPADRPRD
jgi:hypothetical protein